MFLNILLVCFTGLGARYRNMGNEGSGHALGNTRFTSPTSFRVAAANHAVVFIVFKLQSHA